MRTTKDMAYPSSGPWDEKGMELRDYFAAKIVGAVIGNEALGSRIATGMQRHEEYADVLAAHCYRIADAMMKERVK